jgi:FkbM family methyltransferase
MKRKGGMGWMPAMFASGVTPEETFWQNLELKGLVVYDVGAFHGLLTLLFSSRAKQVVSFEPNSKNRKRLMENINLNNIQNVTVRPVGLGSSEGTRKMVGNPLMPGGSSVDEIRVAELLQAGEETVVEQVTIVTLDEEVPRASLPIPDFIKIDIEGLELEALRGARQILGQHKPTLFLEMHGETIEEKKRKVAEIVSFLEEIQYGDILHIETGTAITSANSAVAMNGHLFCHYGPAKAH